MPTSPVEPVNGASNLPQRAQEAARHDARPDAHLPGPRPSPARPSTVSLLTQAFSPAQFSDDSNTPTPRLAPTTTSLPSLPHDHDDYYPRAHNQDHGDSNITLDGSVDRSGMTIPLPTMTNACAVRTVEENPSVTAWTNLFSDTPRRSLILRGNRSGDGSRYRGTSLERTEKERRVENTSSTTAYAQNPGDVGMKHHQQLESQSRTDSPGINENPPVDGFRAQYRSWRHPGTNMEEKAWSICQNDADDGVDGQVELSIAEALAGEKPSSRSRKASHSLRYFRQGLPEEHKKQSKTRTKSRERSNKPTLETIDDLPSPGDTASRKASRSGSTTSSPLSTGSRDDSPAPSYFDIPTSSPPDEHHQPHRPTLPAPLLEEIRKHHNLTPGAGKGSSFSRSIPVLLSEKERAAKLQQENVEAVRESDETPPSDHPEEEDEESGEEHISSALFVPHQTSHEPSDAPRLSRTPSRTQAPNSGEPEQWLVEHQVSSHEVSEDESHDLPSPAFSKPPVSPGLPVRRDTFSDRHTPKVDDLTEHPLRSPAKREHHGRANDIVEIAVDEDTELHDNDFTPTDRNKGLYMTESQKQHLHSHQQAPKAPLDAVELIPYRHQVGGHTTMWRFSKRAVCKQLNNRENEFYEKVERYHPQLLKFLPRYIGVLNVTFKKRKSKKERQENGLEPTQTESNSSVPTEVGSTVTTGPASPDEQPRLISQSLAPSQAQVPTVSVANNAHIIPKQFLHSPLQLAATPFKSLMLPHLDTSAGQSESRSAPPSAAPDGDRPSMYDRSTVSWGATTVNKRLRNEVFGEAFLRRPIPVHRHKKGGNQRALTSRGKSGHLRGAISESDLVYPQKENNAEQGQTREKSSSMSSHTSGVPGEMTPLTPMSSASSVKQPMDKPGLLSAQDFDEQVEDTSGRSAPDPALPPDLHDKKKRRYSSGGLRRKPAEVSTERGTLTYYEEADDAGYRGDGEDDVFKMDPEPAQEATPLNPEKKSDNHLDVPVLNAQVIPPTPTFVGASSTVLPEEGLQLPPHMTTRPANPKEAQTQDDSRVEYFLLLEDLTAGMKRPCIMDLKMGTRQYGVDATEKKQKSQRNKCAHTTSLELGVRVCGLQVWDVSTQSYYFKDKYYGRDLKAGQEFQDALARFLYDGVDNSSILRHIPTIIRKLSELEILIRGLRGYRFYAASLLMFYDGDPEYEDDTSTDNSMTSTKTMLGPRNEIDFKIADFANCVTPQDVEEKQRSCPPQHPTEADHGFLRGLKSLKKYFLKIQQDIREKERIRGRPIGKNQTLDYPERQYEELRAGISEPSDDDDNEVSC